MGSATSSMAAKLAFHPPNPPTYKIITDEDTGNMRLTSTRVRDNLDVLKILTTKGNQIIAVFVKNPCAKLTVLYSHGNATDLGQALNIFLELSDNLGVNILGYDYSGYGQSSGKPNEQDTYSDIEAAYRILREKYELQQQDIILYGQSVGSGPTLELAIKLPELRAVILHSAILSGLRVMYSVKRSYWFDIYKNVDKISRVNCPVLVIHGTADDVVPCSHGKKLWELCKKKYEPLWVEGGEHCNLEMHPQFWTHLKNFISAVDMLPARQESLIPSMDKLENIKERSRVSIDDKENLASDNQRENSRRSVDSALASTSGGLRIRTERARKSASVDRSEKARKSFERFGVMVRSVGLCNVDCFKQTNASLQSRKTEPDDNRG